MEVEPWEKALQERLRNAGARPDPALGLARMRYAKAVELRVRRHLVSLRPLQKGGQK